MELRCHDDASAIKTPTGYIPEYDDLKSLFQQVLKKEYTQEEYIKQFTLRIPENLSKIDRIMDIYKNKIPQTPELVFSLLEEQKERLLVCQKEQGDHVSPFDLKK